MSNNKFKIAAVTENRIFKKKIGGLKPQLNSENAFKNTDLIIDFSVPKCTLEVLKLAKKLKKRVVIGTTGFNKREELLIKKFSKTIPILKAGNMSLGVNLLMYLTEIASKSLGNNFLSKVYEVHHKHKIDYPSGTALMLGKGIADGKNKNLFNISSAADVIGFGAAIDYLTKIGMDNVRQHEIELTKYAMEKFSKIPGLQVYGTKDISKRGGVISFNFADVHPHDVADIIDKEGISLRSGHHCAQVLIERLSVAATSRASFYIYNTKEDIDALIDSLNKVAKVFKL